MNQDAIIALYQEFALGLKELQKNTGSLTAEQVKKMEGFQLVIDDLMKVAEENGFADEMAFSRSVEIDETDDFEQMIDASDLDVNLRNALKRSLNQWLESGNKIIRKNVWKVVRNLNQYYQANVLNVSAVTIPTRLKGKWKQIFGQEIKDLELVALAYQESTKAALMSEITSLINNNWEASTDRVSDAFEANFKGKKTWLLGADMVDNAKSQFKLDLMEFKLPTWNLKYVVLKSGKLQISGKLGFTQPVFASAQKKVLDDYANVFVSGIRNTLSANIKDLAEKGMFQKGSTTLLSTGISFPIPDYGLVLTLKVDGGKLSWGEAIDKAKKQELGESMDMNWGLRISVQVDIKKFLIACGILEGINGTVLDDSFCKLAVSAGWDISVDWASFAKIEGKAYKQPKKIADDDIAKAIEKDKKIAKEIQDKQKNLIKKADKLADAVDKKDVNAMKKAAQEVRESAKDIQKVLNKHDFHDKKVHKAIQEGIEEASEKIYKKLAGPIAKMSKAFKYAKPLAKFIPGINALFTVIEVATFVISFVNWLSTVDANTWEDYFIAAGQHMSDNYGGWFRALDAYMRG